MINLLCEWLQDEIQRYKKKQTFLSMEREKKKTLVAEDKHRDCN